jgi:uroporphyrinogen decarboxylase
MCVPKTLALREKSDLLKIKLPDPYSAGRMPIYMEACRMVRSQIKDSSVGGNIAGPWTIAVGLRDAQTLLKDCMKDPPFIHALMELTTEVCRTFSLALATTGVGLSIGEPTASCSLTSPRIYREFIFPYHQKLISALHNERLSVTLHVCGYSDPILEDLINTGADALSIDSSSSLPLMVNLAQKRTVVIGNVSTRLFYQGSREEMEAEVKRCIEVAAKHSGFILSTGCEVPYIATPERIGWFMEAGEKFGTYTSPPA